MFFLTEHHIKTFKALALFLLTAGLMLLVAHLVEPFLPARPQSPSHAALAAFPMGTTGVFLHVALWISLPIIGALLIYRMVSVTRPMGKRLYKSPKNPKKRLAYAKELVTFCGMSGTLRDFAKVVIRDNSLTLEWFQEAGLESKDLDVLAGLLLEIEADKIAQAA